MGCATAALHALYTCLTIVEATYGFFGVKHHFKRHLCHRFCSLIHNPIDLLVGWLGFANHKSTFLVIFRKLFYAVLSLFYRILATSLHLNWYFLKILNETNDYTELTLNLIFFIAFFVGRFDLITSPWGSHKSHRFTLLGVFCVAHKLVGFWMVDWLVRKSNAFHFIQHRMCDVWSVVTYNIYVVLYVRDVCDCAIEKKYFIKIKRK